MLTPKRYESMQTAFLAVCDCAPGERERSLEDACRGDGELREAVLRLLKADEALEGILGTANALAGSSARATASPAVEAGARAPVTSLLPERIGHYAIRGVLGEGGMGVVYRAEQDHPRREVALKVIRPGASSRRLLRRLEHEAELLGRLRHPGIAQIFEAGTAEVGGGPQPFFAMELVTGEPITAYAERCSLTTPERLELFAKVCEAVEHAHQKGVIHRDLKPGNILIDESGQPKILDFGVARAIDSDIQTTTLQTDIGQLIGTIPYMSPEQVCGNPLDLDTRSDVYSLGVLGYELLAGRLPYVLAGKVVPEAVRVIREQEATPLSLVQRAFRGDLDTVFAKALEKDRERRYPSAATLADDIRRHLTRQPVLARRSSTWYQFRKLVARHRALSIAAASLFLTVSASAVVMTALYRQSQAHLGAALTAKSEALRHARTSERVRDFMTDVFKSLGPSRTRDQAVSVADVLAAARQRLVGSLETEPLVKAALLYQLGLVQSWWGYLDESRPLFEAALRMQREHLPPGHADTLKTLTTLALICLNQGHRNDAEAHIDEALTMFAAQSQPDQAEWAEALTIKGRILCARGAHAEAMACYERALALWRAVFREDSIQVVHLRHCIANVKRRTGELAASQQILEDVVCVLKRILPPDRTEIGEALRDLGKVLRLRGHLQESEDTLRDAWDRMQRYLGAGNPRTFGVLQQLVLTLKARGKLAEAETLLREAIVGGTSPPPYLCLELGKILMLAGRSPEAEVVFRECLESLEADPTATSEPIARTRKALEQCLADLAQAVRARESLPEQGDPEQPEQDDP